VKRGAVALLALGGATFLYRRAVRPWHLRWGASDEEVSTPHLGDELVAQATLVSTRAVTIDAPPEDVWPWLVQLGQGRGGFYTYDRLENLFRLDIHSADRIVPELQQLEVGDVVALAPSGAGLVVAAVVAGRALVLMHPDGGWTWAFTVGPADDGRARLVVRNRWTTAGAPLGFRVALAVIEPSSFVMERGMLLGIKRRAEKAVVRQSARPLP
jgi:hypothetical protein